MNQKDILLEEYRALRQEILERVKILHGTINLAAILWVVFILIGMLIIQSPPAIFYTFLLIIPLVFVGLTFNYQDNQRTLEATARYIDEVLKPKMQEFLKVSFEWESFFGQHKERFQFSSSFKLFALIVPFAIPILLLIFETLTNFQTYLALADIFLLFVIIVNFRYKFYRIK